MPQIPINSPLSYIGISLLFLGFFLILSGFGIIKTKQITVKPGKNTWIVGIVLVVIGVLFLAPDIYNSLPQTLTRPTTPTVNISADPSLNKIMRFKVLAKEQKNRTGMLVAKGDRMYFEYLDGQWAGSQEAPLSSIGCGSKSDDPDANHQWPFPPEEVAGALIGYIGDQQVFLIGCSPVPIEAIVSGELYLGMNDCSGCFWDNKGEINVSISKSP